jgi:hypothetical protein
LDDERRRWWARELADAVLARQLVAGRASLVRPVPDELARRHLLAMMAESQTSAADRAPTAADVDVGSVDVTPVDAASGQVRTA